MPKLAQPLTEVQISKAKAKAKPYRLADGNGLYLAVSTAGTKAWTVRYRLPDGKQAAPATIGHYPALSLAEARVRAVQALRDAKHGKTTAGVRKAQQAAKTATAVETAESSASRTATEYATLRAVSARWLAEKRLGWAIETYRKARLVVDSYLVPALGDKDTRVIETKEVRPALLKMATSTPALARKPEELAERRAGQWHWLSALEKGARGRIGLGTKHSGDGHGSDYTARSRATGEEDRRTDGKGHT